MKHVYVYVDYMCLCYIYKLICLGNKILKFFIRGSVGNKIMSYTVLENPLPSSDGDRIAFLAFS